MKLVKKILIAINQTFEKPELESLPVDFLMLKAGMVNDTGYYSGLGATLRDYYLGDRFSDEKSALMRIFRTLEEFKDKQSAFEFVVVVMSMKDLAPTKFIFAMRNFAGDNYNLDQKKASKNEYEIGKKDPEDLSTLFFSHVAENTKTKDTQKIKTFFLTQLVENQYLSKEQIAIAKQFLPQALD